MSQTTLTKRAEVADLGSVGAAPAGRKRILLVEGDGFTRLVLLLRLRLAGFGVEFTSNGILGLGKLRNSHPDVLLLDLKLCGLSGLDLIKAARAEGGFGERPIYVYTTVDRMNRATRKEVTQLATKVLDKKSVTREDLVELFAKTFLPPNFRRAEPSPEPPAPSSQPLAATKPANDTVPPGAIDQIIAGVREQSERLSRCAQMPSRANQGAELLSRVCSLGSCAEAAGLPNLARQARAVERFLVELGKKKQSYTDEALRTIARGVDVMSRISTSASGKAKSLSRFSAALVDETPSSGRALKEGLAKTGFEPIAFEVPGAAREYLASNGTQLIIANVQLPEAHGLGLADVRRLPLHSKTPVLFAPERTVKRPLSEELPTSAPELSSEPLLLAELILKALNEVQSPGEPGQPETSAVLPGSKAAANCPVAANQPLDDGFELFSRAPGAATSGASIPAEPAQIDSAAAAPAAAWPVESLAEQGAGEAFANTPEQPEEAGHNLFTAADIPSGPIFRMEPAKGDGDLATDLPIALPVTPIEHSQVDETPIAMVPPSDMELQIPQAPLPEPAGDAQVTEVMWRRATPQPGSETILASNSLSSIDQNTAAPEEQSPEAAANDVQIMNNQVEAVPAEYALEQNGNDASPHNQSRDDLATRVCAAEMALYRAQSQLERRDQMIDALQKQLSETTAAHTNSGENGAAASLAEPSAGEQKAIARCAELEEELASLRQVVADLNGNFGQEQPAANDAGKQVQELQQRLNEHAAEVERQKAERSHAEADFKSQLEAADVERQAVEGGRQQAEARCAELQREVVTLRQAREELASKFAQEQKASAEAAARLADLQTQAPGDSEQQLRHHVAALARATAELARERGERQRSEHRAAELNARLQSLHEDLRRSLESQREDLARINALDEQHRQASQALDQRTAELEQQHDERRLLEERLQKLNDMNAQLRKDLTFFEEANKKFDGSRQELQAKLEASLAVAREHETRLQQEKAERQRLGDSLEGIQRELQNETLRCEGLEQQLKTTQAALQDTEARLQKETAERQQLSQALDSVQRNDRAGSERDLEFSKLRSALQHEQVERKRQESQMAHLRHSALDSVHAARALRASMRRQIREPVDNVVQSARSLLELEMTDDQKKLAEAVLQEVLLVQTRLREPELAQEPQGQASASEPTET